MKSNSFIKQKWYINGTPCLWTAVFVITYLELAINGKSAFLPTGQILGIAFGFSLMHIATAIIEDKRLKLLMLCLSLILLSTSVGLSVYSRLTA